MESRGANSSVFRYVDWPTIVLYLILVFAGAISIYAACYDYDFASVFDFNEFSGKQIRWIGFSLVLGLVLLLFDARIYETYAYPIYIAVVLVLLITIFVAKPIQGSRSWLVFGPMHLQPAEFGKFATALALAKLFSGYNFKLNANKSNYLKALAIIFLPILIILAQNETGSALAYTALFFVLYREGMSGLVLMSAALAVVIFVVALKFTSLTYMGIPSGEMAVMLIVMLIMVCMVAIYCKQPRSARNLFIAYVGTFIIASILCACGVHVPGTIYFLTMIIGGCIYCVLLSLHQKGHKLLITAGAALASVMFMYSVDYAFNNILQHHQQQRIRVTLGIEEDLLAAGYNVNQSKIAIGSGGFFGKGYLNGTQTKLKYVPEQHTDFIFCTIGEEQGFVGSSAVLLLFLILILRIIHIAERQPTVFGRVYAYCVASFFIFHLAVNVGMVIGLCPVIGIPLPFFSYGGSSLWGFSLLLFILLRIDAARREHLTY